MRFKNNIWNLSIWSVKSPLCLCPQEREDRQPFRQCSHKADGWMPKYTGNPFKNLLSSRLDLWKVKASKVVGMGWGRLKWRFKFRAGMRLSKRKSHHRILPHSPPDGKLSCWCSNKHMGLMFHVEETRAQAEHSAALWFAMVTLHPREMYLTSLSPGCSVAGLR